MESYTFPRRHLLASHEDVFDKLIDLVTHDFVYDFTESRISSIKISQLIIMAKERYHLTRADQEDEPIGLENLPDGKKIIRFRDKTREKQRRKGK